MKNFTRALNFCCSIFLLLTIIPTNAIAKEEVNKPRLNEVWFAPAISKSIADDILSVLEKGPFIRSLSKKFSQIDEKNKVVLLVEKQTILGKKGKHINVPFGWVTYSNHYIQLQINSAELQRYTALHKNKIKGINPLCSASKVTTYHPYFTKSYIQVYHSKRDCITHGYKFGSDEDPDKYPAIFYRTDFWLLRHHDKFLKIFIKKDYIKGREKELSIFYSNLIGNISGYLTN